MHHRVHQSPRGGGIAPFPFRHAPEVTRVTLNYKWQSVKQKLIEEFPPEKNCLYKLLL